MRKNNLPRVAIVLAMGFMTIFAGARVTLGDPASHSGKSVVPNGTHFLVRLEGELDSGKNKVNEKIDAKTVEPLETPDGAVLPPGATIHGHISRIEPAGLAGRARIWLTFDDIETRNGSLPIVAEVSSAPGDFSVKPGESTEGEIESHSDKRTQEAESAAVGAAKGASAGVASHCAKCAATGAAAGAIVAFLASSGLGHELDLPKGTKLDLVLDRPLHLAR